jgi:hypothetical protein
MDDVVADRQPWEPLRLAYVGHVAELVQSGTAKSGDAADPGDPGKPPAEDA